MDYSICCIKGCDLPTVALGLCNKHWRRNKKYGSPVATRNNARYRGIPEKDRFWLYVRKSDECWEWIGGKDRDGYGIFTIKLDSKKRKATRAPRVAWILTNGEIASRMCVCHKCDNPGCVNPDHLFLGSAADNNLDKIRKGRHRYAKGMDVGHAKLTEDQVLEILKDPRPYTEISADYEVTALTIRDIKQRKSWKHLGIERVKRTGGTKGEKRHNAQLTESDVLVIRASGETGKSLSEQYCVSQQTICDIRKHRSWKHI